MLLTQYQLDSLMVGQIVAFGDLLVFVDNGKDLNGKKWLREPRNNYGLKGWSLPFQKQEKNLFGSTHPVYRAIKGVIMWVKAQFAKRLCQSYHRKCQRSNQAIILCHETLKIAFEISKASSLGCNKLRLATKIATLLLFLRNLLLGFWEKKTSIH